MVSVGDSYLNHEVIMCNTSTPAHMYLLPEVSQKSFSDLECEPLIHDITT